MEKETGLMVAALIAMPRVLFPVRSVAEQQALRSRASSLFLHVDMNRRNTTASVYEGEFKGW